MPQQSFLSMLELAFGAQLLAVAAVLAGLILIDWQRRQKPERRKLEVHFGYAPLQRMLMRRGRNPQFYLEHVSTPDLQQHLQTCGGCRQRSYCLSVLKQPTQPLAYGFCPNAALIEKLPVSV